MRAHLRRRPAHHSYAAELHLGWIVGRKTHAVIYIGRDQEGCRRIEGDHGSLRDNSDAS